MSRVVRRLLFVRLATVPDRDKQRHRSPQRFQTERETARTATGTFTVTVTVTDDDGGSHTQSFNVVVTVSIPTVSNLVVNNVNENGTATLTGNVNDGGSGDDPTLAINWGDGSPIQTLLLPSGTTAFNTSHVYRDDNPTGTSTTTINLTLTDETLNSGTYKPIDSGLMKSLSLNIIWIRLRPVSMAPKIHRVLWLGKRMSKARTLLTHWTPTGIPHLIV